MILVIFLIFLPELSAWLSERFEFNLSFLNDSRQRIESASRQMTIFYGGQAHVFDKVHPDKVCFLHFFDQPFD